MNLSKVKHVFKKARRSMYGSAPDMRGITSVTSITKRSNSKNLIQVQHELWGQVSFYLGARPITIHGEMGLNQGGICDDKPQRYLEKLEQLDNILRRALIHLGTKSPERLVIRGFLNSATDNNDYGSSAMIVIPEMKEKHLFCTLEISSCHFKSRQNPDRKELMRLLKFMLKHLGQHMDDYKLAVDKWRNHHGK